MKKKALDRLLEYHWPGNIRELRNILKLTITESQSDYIKVEELPDFKSENLDYLKTRTDFEKSYLQEIFNKNDKNIDKMAVFLNMERKALLKKIEKLNLKLIEKNLSS
ncbi:MAG: hypothetical protein CL678_14965 [Bdellovibrionaceae bacterium]|nr:hypothetical protein [Pseudobdellovibrionaceae bacterium]